MKKIEDDFELPQKNRYPTPLPGQPWSLVLALLVLILVYVILLYYIVYSI